MITKEKTPGDNSRLDYVFDWRKWLIDGDTLDTIAVTVREGDVSIDGTPVVSDGQVQVWVKGGTVNTEAIVSCYVITVNNRKETKEILFKIRN